MKKKFFMLLAAVLLGSVSAFAQGGNNNPAKGDVNSDGIVDVADINAILKIMRDGGGPVTVGGYFYLGTTKPTAANYKTLPGVVTTYTSIDDAVGATASVAAGETLYMLCPAAWMTEKNAALEDKSGNTIDFLDEIDDATISGYVIYKTQAWNAPNDVVLKTKYYYSVGTTEVTSSNYTTVNSAQYVTNVNNIPSSLNISTLTGPVYILLPSGKTPTIVPNSGAGTVALTSLTSPVSGYSYWKSARFAAGATMTISTTYKW